MSHTPGPWEYAKIPNQNLAGHTGYVVTDAHGIVVAEAFTKTYPVAISEPNARLIAAAPELLFALERYVELHDNDCVEVDSASDLLKDARAAIAKAKGVA